MIDNKEAELNYLGKKERCRVRERNKLMILSKEKGLKALKPRTVGNLLGYEIYFGFRKSVEKSFKEYLKKKFPLTESILQNGYLQ